MFKAFIQKLITSSHDPKKVSLAVQGVIILAGSQVVKAVDFICGVGLTCVGIDTGLVKQIADGAEAVVYGALLVIGAIYTVVGLFRKAYNGRWSAPVEN